MKKLFNLAAHLCLTLTLLLLLASVAAAQSSCQLSAGGGFCCNWFDAVCQYAPVDRALYDGLLTCHSCMPINPTTGDGLYVGGTRDCTNYPKELVLTFAEPVREVSLGTWGARTATDNRGFSVNLDSGISKGGFAYFPGDGITSITLKDPFYNDDQSWVISANNVHFSPASCAYCTTPMIIQPQPVSIKSFDLNTVNFTPWSMDVSVSPQDGLVLSNVKLGQRYFAEKISVPYFTLETNMFSKRRGELKPAGTDAVMRSQLVNYNVFSDAEKLVIEANYRIDQLPAPSQSCLIITQRYEFYNVKVGDRCEPSGSLDCARWKPIVKYRFLSKNSEVLKTINIVQRQHLTIDGNQYNSGAFLRDNDISTQALWQGGFSNRLNPLFEEWHSFVVVGGKDMYQWDNYHQTYKSFIEEPYVFRIPTDGNFSIVHPGCAECVHSHWRWGTLASIFSVPEGGGDLINIGSNQDFDIGVSLNQPNEEHPTDFLTLIQFGTPVRTFSTAGRDPSQIYKSSAPEDIVLWQSAYGYQSIDTFFAYGSFISPLQDVKQLYGGGASSTASQAKVDYSVAAESLAPASSGQDGITSITANNIYATGTTTVSLFDPTPAPPLPTEYALYNSLSFDIATDAESSGPYVVTFNVPSVTDQTSFGNLRILHLEPDQYDSTKIVWVDRTVQSPDPQAPDFAGRMINAKANSLGQYAVVLMTQPPNTGVADLAVTMSDSTDPVTAGNNLTYTVNVTNNGPQAATEVVLVNAPAPNERFISAVPSQGTCIEEDGTVSCKLGTLAAGASATVSIIVKAVEGSSTILAAGQTMASIAHVQSKESDTNSTNNTVTENTTLLPDPNAAPTIDITSPTTGAMFVGPASINITANAADTDGSISKVEFFDGSNLIGTGTATGPTQFSFMWSNVPAKNYTIVAVATDNLGKAKLSQPVSIIVNGLASVIITSPLQSATFNAPANVTIAADASYNGGSISKVDFYASGVFIGHGTVTGTGQYSFTWNDPSHGVYFLAAVATDELGVTTTSNPVKVTINSLPVVKITSPTTGSGFTAPTGMTITANALDVDGGISKVDFYANGTLIGTATPGVYQYSFNWTNVAAGNYSLTAVTTDYQGAMVTSSAVNITVNAPPVVSITSPTNGSTFSAPANIAVTATASDDGNINKMEFFANGFKIGDGTLTGLNQYSVNWANVSLGAYTLSAVATDNLGVKTTASVSVKSFLPVLFVAGSTTLNNSDAAIKTRLETVGYAVTIKDDVTATSADANGMAVVIISSTVSPTNVGTKFRTVAVPVITWESALYSNMGMTATQSTNYGSTTGQTQVNITNSSHPLASGLSGAMNVVNVSGTLSWGKPNASAASVATISGDATKVVIFGYEKAAAMPGLAAPARRVGLYMFDDTAENFTSNGAALFDAAMKWVLGTTSLSATSAVVPNGSSIDLTAEGSVDWVHWGLDTASSVNRKSMPYQKLSNYSWVGNGSVNRYADNANFYSWSDGAPTQAVSNTTTGIMTNGLANGFQINVPADTNLRTVRLYVGVWYAQAKLQVSMSDGSVPAYVDSSLNNSGGGTHGVYTISFKAAAGNQNLSIKYTLQADYNAPYGNIALDAITLFNGGPPNVRPVSNITSPGNGATFNAPANIIINANASDSDGTISKVEFFANSSKISEATTAPYNFVWNNVVAGNYTLSTIATDNNGATSDNLNPIDIVVVGNGGGLFGSMAVPAVPRQVNLTSEGTLDWAHWGLNTTSSFDRKAGVTPQIGNYTNVGLNSPGRFADNPTGFTWSDGAPTTSTVNSTTGIYVGGLNNGFQITVPADTSPKTLKLYVGLWSAQGKLQATLSDASAMPYTDSSLINLSSTSNGVYTIAFKAASNGQTLKVKWTMLSGQGNVTLEAATLVNGGTFNTPPAVSITSPASGAAYAVPANVTINANASDSDGSVSKVEFFANSGKIGQATTTPYSFTWNNVAAGNYTLTAVATDNNGATTTSGSVNISILSSALFVTGSTTLSTSDAAIKTRLQNLGYSVTVKDATSALTTDANGKTVVVISSTVNPTNLGTKFKSVTVPVVMWESLSYFDMGMTAKGTTNASTATGQTQVKITQPSHALAGGLSGTQTVVTASSTFAWGKPNANAASIASLVSDSTKIVIFGYGQGVAMPGLTAPAKRVGLFMNDTTAASFNNNGWVLFDAAINWAASPAP